MPYSINPKDGQFEVVNEATGEVVGTHPTRAQALEQQRALYANVPDVKAAYDWDKCMADQMEEYGDEETAKKVCGSIRAKYGEYRAMTDKERGDIESELGVTRKESKRSLIERVIAAIKGKATTKEESLNQFQGRIYTAFSAQFPASQNYGLDYSIPSASPWIVDVFPDHVIISYGEDFFSATMMIAPDGSIDFAEQSAWVKVKKLEAWVEKAARVKEGRRNATTDQSRLQQIHDLAVENGATCPLIYKQADGRHRWILLSSNSYQDRDGEIVSQAAQEADTEHLTATKQYGPLRLWHMGYPDTTTKDAGPGVDIGDCDYSRMIGRVRVESGTFRDERIAAAIKGRSDQWAGSLGFFHGIDQPDQDGVFNGIQTFERSLLPAGRQSAYFAPLAAIIKENDMTTKEQKVKELADLLGDQALADAVIKQVGATEKAADERGLRYKQAAETQAEVTPAEKAAKKVDVEDILEAIMPEIEAAIDKKLAGMKEAATKEASDRAALTEQIAALQQTVKELVGEQPRGFFGGFRPSQSETTIMGGITHKSVNADPLDSVLDQLMGVKKT